MMLNQLLYDESGFIVSAELVLVGTLLVLGVIVGLSEVQHAVNQELNDVGDAFGNMNQSYCYSGFSARKRYGGHCGFKSITTGSFFSDTRDECDQNQCSISCDIPVAEHPKYTRSGGTVIENNCAPNSEVVK